MKKTEAGRKSTSVFPLLTLSAFQSMFLLLKIAAERFDSRYTLHKTGSVQGFTSVRTVKLNLVYTEFSQMFYFLFMFFGDQSPF